MCKEKNPNRGLPSDLEIPPDVNITPEMLAAGVEVLAWRHGVVSEWAAEELAIDVFVAMVRRSKTPADGRGSIS